MDHNRADIEPDTGVLREDHAVLSEDDVDSRAREVTDTDLYEGNVDQDTEAFDRDTDTVVEDLTSTGMRPGETANPDIAAEEGLTWVPPIDPPVVPAADGGGIQMAAGFGASANESSTGRDDEGGSLAADDDLTDRVEDALRSDAATSALIDHVQVLTDGSRVVLRGEVEDVEDSDEIVAVAERVRGVSDVIDELGVRSMDDHPGVG